MAFELCCFFGIIIFLAIIVFVEMRCYNQGYLEALKYYHRHRIIKIYHKEESKGSYERGWNDGMKYVRSLLKV